jgi:hypothetical protein
MFSATSLSLSLSLFGRGLGGVGLSPPKQTAEKAAYITHGGRGATVPLGLSSGDEELSVCAGTGRAGKEAIFLTHHHLGQVGGALEGPGVGATCGHEASPSGQSGAAPGEPEGTSVSTHPDRHN